MNDTALHLRNAVGCPVGGRLPHGGTGLRHSDDGDASADSLTGNIALATMACGFLSPRRDQ
jgi:hypothetical protein